MKTDNPQTQNPFSSLVTSGALTSDNFEEACQIASNNNLPLVMVLMHDYSLPQLVLRQALADHYNCSFIEYDERLPIPPEFLKTGITTEQLQTEGWFPVIREKDGLIVIACTNPADSSLSDKVSKYLGSGHSFDFRVCLPDDITWFTEDYLHAEPGKLIGTERTGLAYWRNNMAQWRTLLACYRTDMAQSRTALAITRAGLALIAITFAYYRIHDEASPITFIGSTMLIGSILSLIGLPAYLRIRHSRLKPPKGQTLMEVTATTTTFLENYHVIDDHRLKTGTRETMLGRLSDLLEEYCTILDTPPASKVRTHLARERNVLAAQRTIAACNRTLYARARTGLAFMRTGIAFMSIGIGLLIYFGVGLDAIFYGSLIVIGLLLTIDGILWYIPAYKQQADFSKLGTRFCF